MASINNKSYNNVNVLHEQDQVKQSLDAVEEQYYSKVEMSSVLAPINTDMDAVESGLTHKLDKAGGTLTGNIDMNSNKIESIGTPTSDTDASTKKYVDDSLTTSNTYTDTEVADLKTYTDTQDGLKFDKTGGAITGNVSLNTSSTLTINNPDNSYYVFDCKGKAVFKRLDVESILNMNGNTIINVSTPVGGGAAANKSYTDTQDALKFDKTGGAINGNVSMNTSSTLTLNNTNNGGYVFDCKGVAQVQRMDLRDQIDMKSNKIVGLAPPLNGTDVANKNYVDDTAESVSNANIDALKVNNNVYTFESNTTDSNLITVPFSSSTSAVRAFLGFKVVFYSKAAGFTSGDTNIRVAYYTVELNRGNGIKQPTYYLGPKNDNSIAVETKQSEILIYLIDSSPVSTSERGSVLIEFYKPPNCNFGNITFTGNYSGTIPSLTLSTTVTLATIDYVDSSVSSSGAFFFEGTIPEFNIFNRDDTGFYSSFGITLDVGKKYICTCTTQLWSESANTLEYDYGCQYTSNAGGSGYSFSRSCIDRSSTPKRQATITQVFKIDVQSISGSTGSRNINLGLTSRKVAPNFATTGPKTYGSYKISLVPL